jgi:hypothetical protein
MIHNKRDDLIVFHLSVHFPSESQLPNNINCPTLIRNFESGIPTKIKNNPNKKTFLRMGFCFKFSTLSKRSINIIIA